MICINTCMSTELPILLTQCTLISYVFPIFHYFFNLFLWNDFWPNSNVSFAAWILVVLLTLMQVMATMGKHKALVYTYQELPFQLLFSKPTHTPVIIISNEILELMSSVCQNKNTLSCSIVCLKHFFCTAAKSCGEEDSSSSSDDDDWWLLV